MEATGARLDTLQAIELAEGVEVRLRIAGPVQRGVALGLDLLFQWGFLIVVVVVLSIAGVFTGSLVAFGVMMLVWFFLSWWYAVFLEASKWGATFGKKIVGLRVVQQSGSPITFSQAVLRNFLRWADAAPYLGAGIGGLPTFGFGLGAILATRRFQRLGDLAAGTVVVYDKIPPEPVVAPPPAMEAMRPTLALRPEEVKAVVAFRERSGLWSEGRRREIADHARDLTGAEGAAGVSRLMSMAHWLQERR